MPTPAPAPVGPPDPNFSSVVFLSGFKGGATDQSPSPKAITQLGGASVGAPSKFGSSAAQIDGVAGSGFACADDAAWNFGTGNFTVEGWFNWSSAALAGRTLLSQFLTTGDQRAWRLQWTAAAALTLQVTSLGTAATTIGPSGSFTPVAGQWYHIAFDYDGTTLRLYVDGVILGQTATTAGLFDSTARMIVGATDTGASTSSAFLGNIDEVRITKGVARYGTPAAQAGETIFVPPTAAFPRS